MIDEPAVDSTDRKERLVMSISHSKGPGSRFPAAKSQAASRQVLEALTWLIGRAVAERIIDCTGLVGATRMNARELSTAAEIPLAVAERVVACRYVGTLFLHERCGIAAPVDVLAHLPPLLATDETESLYALALDAANNLIDVVLIAKGGASETAARPRDVLTPLVRRSASGFILAHNHPSGGTAPSEEDIAFTNRMAFAGAVVGVPLIDHVLVAGGVLVSFFELGLLPTHAEISSLFPDGPATDPSPFDPGAAADVTPLSPVGRPCPTNL